MSQYRQNDVGPDEYVTSKQGQDLLGVDRSTFFYHVEKGDIQTEPGRAKRDGRYRLTDILKVKAKRRARKQRPKELLVDWLKVSDLPGILELDLQVFDNQLVGDYNLYASWLTRNPHIAMGVFNRHNRRKCYAYVSMLPLPENIILDVLSGVRDELSIQADEIQTYDAPGEYSLLANSAVTLPDRPALLYVVLERIMQHWTEQYPTRQVARIFAQAASESGDILIQKLFMAPLYRTVENTMLPIHNAYVLDLRRPGATRVIRSFQNAIKRKGEGLEIAPSISSGLPSFKAPEIPAPSVEVASSRISAPRQKPAPTSTPVKSTLPPGYIAFRHFAKAHGISESTAKNAIESGRLTAEKGNWKVDRFIVTTAFNEDQQRAFVEAYRSNSSFQQCEDPTCVCHN